LTLGTKVYGASDDLIEFEGDIHGEVSCYGTDDRPNGVLIIFSDGTLLEFKYDQEGIWRATLKAIGSLFDRIQHFAGDDDAEINSDIVWFEPVIKWAYACTGEWERVR
jgi:hypothetical protein